MNFKSLNAFVLFFLYRSIMRPEHWTEQSLKFRLEYFRSEIIHEENKPIHYQNLLLAFLEHYEFQTNKYFPILSL